VARREPPVVLQGDGVDLLPALLERMPMDLTVCVFHSFVMNQVPRERRAEFYRVLAEQAWTRPIFDISFEGTGAGVRPDEIEMARSVRGEWRRAVLARSRRTARASNGWSRYRRSTRHKPFLRLTHLGASSYDDLHPLTEVRD
jgi:hypothetical protein